MTQAWRGKKVLITAGATREYLDPVRYLTNASSGRMGYAVAAAAQRRGARVTLVTGPASIPAPKGVRVIPVTTARQMLAACLKALPKTDAVIGAAAVSDFRPAKTARGKIKKGGAGLTLRLVPNPDVLALLSRKKKSGRPLMAGFALETKNLLSNARLKMARKGLDLIVANGPDALNSRRTRAVILTRNGRAVPHQGPKTALADKILATLEAFL